MAVGEQPKYTPEDKLHWEVENLRREVAAKSRHPALTPAFWFSLTGTLLALVAAIAQYFASHLEYREASIKKARAELDLARAQEEKSKLAHDIEELKKAHEEMQTQKEEKARELRLLADAIDSFKLSRSPPAPDGPKDFDRLQEAKKRLLDREKAIDASMQQQLKIIERILR
jgi:septal ring factor EnvC (AmiA/AmiB activator)